MDTGRIRSSGGIYKSEAAKQSVSQIERGNAHIPKNKAGKFIKALSIDEQWLLETLNSLTRETKSGDSGKRDLELALAGFAGLFAGSRIASKIGEPIGREYDSVNKKK